MDTKSKPDYVAPEFQKQQLADLQVLNRALIQLTVMQPAPALLEIVLETVYQLVPGAISVRMYLVEADSLQFAAGRWANNSQPDPNLHPPADAFSYRVVKERRQLWQTRPSPLSRAGGVAGLPCLLDGRAAGALLVAVPLLEMLPAYRLEYLQQLAQQTAQAIHISEQFSLLSRQAFTDALTGLPNRRALDEHLEEEVRRSSRYQHAFALLMFDCNGFKQINDTFGHPVGDQVLRCLSDCLRRELRDTDFFARFGGDEFAIILPETERAAAETIASRLGEAVERCGFDLPETGKQRASISIGIAAYPQDAISASGLVTAADQALYRHKNKLYPR